MNEYAQSNAWSNDPFNGPHYGPYRSRVEAWFENAEAEIRHAVAYVDRVIVPEARRETAGAVRILARQLDKLADRLYPLDQTGGNRGQ
jgi:hypothetical protein